MTPPPELRYFVAEITLQKTSEGGRSGPTPFGIFHTIMQHQFGNFSCRLFFGDDEQLHPGQTHTVSVVPLFQEFFSNFSAGDQIGIFDGKRIASGKILTLQ
jgi:hypothetical protein